MTLENGRRLHHSLCVLAALGMKEPLKGWMVDVLIATS